MAGAEAVNALLGQVNNPIPSVQTVPTVVLANSSRGGFTLQNVGTNPLFVMFGTGATLTSYHVILQGGTALSDGKGGVLSQMAGIVYQGVISAIGTLPTYVYAEF